jgi:hypothetical protein
MNSVRTNSLFGRYKSRFCERQWGNKGTVARTRKLDAGKLFELSKLARRAGLDLRGTSERFEIAQPVRQWVPNWRWSGPPDSLRRSTVTL